MQTIRDWGFRYIKRFGRLNLGENCDEIEEMVWFIIVICEFMDNKNTITETQRGLLWAIDGYSEMDKVRFWLDPGRVDLDPSPVFVMGRLVLNSKFWSSIFGPFRVLCVTREVWCVGYYGFNFYGLSFFFLFVIVTD